MGLHLTLLALLCEIYYSDICFTGIAMTITSRLEGGGIAQLVSRPPLMLGTRVQIPVRA